MGDIATEEVKPEAVLAFIAGSGPVTACWLQKYRILGRFYRYAIGRGFEEEHKANKTYRQFYRQSAFPAMTFSNLQRREAPLSTCNHN